MIKNGAEFLEDLNKREVVNLNNPNCINCSECCSILSILSEKEYKFYKKYFKTKVGKLIYESSKKRHREVAEKANALNMTCPFILNSKRCAIYSIRPQICKDFHCDPKFNKSDQDAVNFRVGGYTIKDLFRKKI